MPVMEALPVTSGMTAGSDSLVRAGHHAHGKARADEALDVQRLTLGQLAARMVQGGPCADPRTGRAAVQFTLGEDASGCGCGDRCRQVATV